MPVALVPRATARTAPRPHPLSPIVALGTAAAITLAAATALMALAPTLASAAAPAAAAPVGRDVRATVFGPAVRLPVIQIVGAR
jgi:hypothetical protein